MNIKAFALLLFSTFGCAAQPTGAEVTAARHIFDRTYEAAEVCNYALYVTKQYSDCHEFYSLTVGNSGYESFTHEFKYVDSNRGTPKSDFMKAAMTVQHYYTSLKRSNETDPDFSVWWKQFSKKVIAIATLDLLLYQARVGGLYVPAN